MDKQSCFILSLLPVMKGMRIEIPVVLESHVRKLREQIPPALNKGARGKISIVGGSSEYSGAPYFAAMSALRAGADLAFIHTHPDAAVALKCYSPDTIVYPSFEYLDLVGRSDAVVFGPGLGRAFTNELPAEILLRNVLRGIYVGEKSNTLVLDADALWLFATNTEFRSEILQLKDTNLYLTPNKVEYDRLLHSLRCKSINEFLSMFSCRTVMVRKGQKDLISGHNLAEIEVCCAGSGKRVGGQGDILAGILGLCATYFGDSLENMMSAATCASFITRSACMLAYQKHGTGLVSSDVLGFVTDAWRKIVEDNTADA